MAFDIQLTTTASKELKAIRAFDRRRLVEAIREQLENEPSTPTRIRKLLDVAQADFEFEPPLWELRCGDYRVFYDVDLENHVVHVRAVRRKGRGQTTEDVLHEADDN